MEQADFILPDQYQEDINNASFQNRDTLVFAETAIQSVILAGNSDESIKATLINQLNKNSKAIVLIKPTAADINHLATLGMNTTQTFNVVLPADGALDAVDPARKLPLIYAQKIDSDGNVSVFVHFDDYLIVDNNNAHVVLPLNGQADGFFELKKWLKLKNNDISTPTANDKDILSLAKSYAATLSSNYWGKSFVINQFIIPVHDFGDTTNPTGGSDWYFLQQDGILNGACGYTKETECCYWNSKIINERFWVGRGHVIDNYIRQYEIANNLMVGSLKGNELFNPSPTAINGALNTTTSEGISVGAEVGGGVQLLAVGPVPEVSTKLSFGYSSERSKSFTTFDVSANLFADHTQGRVAWTHVFREPRQDTQAGRWMWLIDGAELSKSTYTPTHMWIWRLVDEQRNSPKMKITLSPERAGAYSRFSGSQSPTFVKGTVPNIELIISLPQPPILAVETHAISFDKKNATKTTRVGSQGAWTAIKGNVSDEWYSFSQQEEKLHITVLENTTGANRSADIWVNRNVGKDIEKQKINIIQFTTNE